MARITKNGTGGAVHISVDGSGNFETIAEIRSWSVDESVDTVEDTNMGSSGVRSYKTTHKTWTGSADLYIPFDDTDTSEQLTEQNSLIATITIGTTYDFKFYADDSTASFESYNGKGIVTGISRSVAHDGMAEMSVTIQGNSALT
tara:strand:- start:647 stop:1081 length:435 start_codon:yes stop_codon:yes gene_type:complete